ncbi:hypothetical protein [Gallaecimonas pentaromativorans]|uniref:Uncharacterized protein n=1 Tax=Gallaecimonas pentaromativorans TaxID=584787 RepID=A0A3N1P836_9GAMM|nr:hypothetical protein [Gallaecimonas pentaromativorans]ROQ27512.1 hypothetical protein EDC28_104162 [Gallaecimonas pentaromativorans]
MTEQEPQTVHVGGSVDKALARAISLNIGAMLKEAWQGAARLDRGMLSPLLMLVGLSLVLGSIMLEVMGMLGWTITDIQGQSLLQLVLTVMLAPAYAGIQLIALQHVVGLRPPLNMLWHWYRIGPVLSLAALLTMAISSLGTALFIIPGLLLQVVLAPVLMLVADKGMSPFAAIRVSVIVGFKYFAAFLVCQLLLIVAVAVGVLTFGLAALWLAPFYLRFQAIIYRELFGVRLKLATGQQQALFNA